MKDCIIVDLDGTLADITHRLHHIQGTKKRWDLFNRAIPQDHLNPWCSQLIASMKASALMANSHLEIVIMTGRMFDEETKVNTIKWLEAHDIAYDELYAREDKDYRKDCEMKKDLYEEHIKPYYKVLFCIDDRQQVVDMWRQEGLVCLQCAHGDF